MTWLTRLRARHERQALLDYWDAIIGQNPATPLPLDSVPAEDAMFIRALHSAGTTVPDQSGFEERLLQVLLARQKELNAMHATASAAVAPLDLGPRSSIPLRRATMGNRSRLLGFPIRRGLIPALELVLVLIFLLGLAAIAIRFTRPSPETSHIAAPPVASPAAESPADMPMYRGNPARTGVLPGPRLEGSPVELWNIQAGEPVNLGLAVVDGVLYWPAGSKGFEARDAMTGDLIWTFASDAAAVSAPAVANGLGFFIDYDSTLYAVHTADGSEAWRMTDINVRSSVAPAGDLVYAASPEGVLYALDAATGTIVWKAGTGAGATGAMAVADGVVFQGNAAGLMSAFDATTGAQRWTFQNQEGRGNATVTVANGQLYITTSGGDRNAIYAVDAASGALSWRQEQGPGAGFISATVTSSRLYSVAEDGTLHAMDAATGETIWEYQLIEFTRSIPVLVDDTLYVADNGGFVRAIDAATGTLDWAYPIEGEVDLGWPVVSNGVLYIGTSFGNFYAIAGAGMAADSTIATPGSGATPPVPPAATSPASITDLPNLVWTSSGNPDQPLDHSFFFTVAPDGTLWVSDGSRSQFQIFSPDGAYLESWGGAGPGSGDGQFNFVRPNSDGDAFGAVAFAPDGSFYVADTGNYRIQHFRADRTFLAAWGTFGGGDGQFVSPLDLVYAGGLIFVCDDRRQDVQVFDATGTFLRKFGEPNGPPFGGAITLAPDGTIWGAGGFPQLHQWSKEGELLQTIPVSLGDDQSPPVLDFIAFDPAGNLIVPDGEHAVTYLIDPRGTVLAEWPAPASESAPGLIPGAVTTGGDGALYVVTYSPGTVTKYLLPNTRS